jgi:AAHS family 4-hydroxybenzoate transporter-like MFS transporter
MRTSFDVEQLIDDQRLRGWHVGVVLLLFLATCSDGFDITVLPFAVPSLVHAWNIAPPAFGPALAASMLGVFVGAPIFGYVGDRIGRRPTLIASCVLYGTTTLVVAWAGNIEQLAILRFIAGLGIAGVIPNAIALTAEMMPKRGRSIAIVVMFTGMTTGGALPGLVVSWLVARYGWPSLFLAGGAAPLVLAVLLALLLPESTKFLALRPERRSRLLVNLRRIWPDLVIADEAELRLDTPPSRKAPFRQIFSDGLVLITPLIWICYASCLMAVYFLVSWLPLLLQSKAVAVTQAAKISALYHLGGSVGAIVVSAILDRFGFVVIAALFGISVPCTVMLGLTDSSIGAIIVAVVVVGIFLDATLTCLNATLGLVYPTQCRGTGVAFATAIGRLGAMSAILIGGALLARKLPMKWILMAPAIPMFVGTIAAILLIYLSYKRFGSNRLGDRSALHDAEIANPPRLPNSNLPVGSTFSPEVTAGAAQEIKRKSTS